MRPSTLRWFLPFTLSLIWAVTAGAASASAQFLSWSRFGIGYVASPPNMMGGVGGYILSPALHGMGLYVDAKWDLSSPAHDPYYISDKTAQDIENTVAGVTYIDKKDSYHSYDAALVRPVTPSLMLYAGGGYVVRHRYNNYQDPARELGQLGLFWVAAPNNTTKTAHAMFGAFLRMGRHLAFQTGFETSPTSFTLGAMLKFPGR